MCTSGDRLDADPVQRNDRHHRVRRPPYLAPTVYINIKLHFTPQQRYPCSLPEQPSQRYFCDMLATPSSWSYTVNSGYCNSWARKSQHSHPCTGSTSTVGDIPCDNHSKALSSKNNTQHSLTPVASLAISLQHSIWDVPVSCQISMAAWVVSALPCRRLHSVTQL